MKLEAIELTNFKNYSKASVQINGRFIFITGNNGQGKTNFLDAIHYLSLTKSFLNPIDNAHIQYDKDFFRISGKYRLDDETFHSVSCIQEKNERKKIIVNDKLCERFADHIGNFPLVVISPADFDLLRGSDERRKFVDSTISQFDKSYLNSLIQYNKILAQRNFILKGINENNQNVSLLDTYDNQLSQFATNIYQKRSEFILGFIPIFLQYYNKITSNQEEVKIEYNSSLMLKNMTSILADNRDKDIRFGHTTDGIHREDFLFYVNNQLTRKFASQGQQKSFLIALKLAKLQFIAKEKMNIPILLIDDLHDKLDSSRVLKLFELLNETDFDQVFITDTQKERILPLISEITYNSSFYTVDNGVLKQ